MTDEREHRWSDDEEDEDGNGPSLSGRVPDFVRKALMTGIGAVFMTEEGVRSALGDNMKLPKEAMQYLYGQADRTKRELIQTMARELRTFLDGLEVDDLARRALAGTTFEINTTIRVVANEEGKLDFQKAEAEKKERDEQALAKVDEEEPEAKPKRKKATRKKKTTKKASE